ncbi:MAG: prepilin-type N-terminal cleavage/methylation domain-containing protein [Candidatus Azotimanducaceae bacterium]|jgi:prepilin-type N-terminal cleavage/methylation domain-containing protein
MAHRTKVFTRTSPSKNAIKLTKKVNGGFTLLEIMISVAILGILSALALPAYQDYINIANMTKVSSHYDEGKRLAATTFTKGFVQQALNQSVTVPSSTNDWIAIFNTTGAQAPGGGLAFISGAATDSKGQIGVQSAGSFPVSSVVISRPGYQDLNAESITIFSASSL